MRQKRSLVCLYILSGKTIVLIYAEIGIGKRKEGEVLQAHHPAALHLHKAAKRKSKYKIYAGRLKNTKENLKGDAALLHPHRVAVAATLQARYLLTRRNKRSTKVIKIRRKADPIH